jgi:hypothetical protein
MESTKYVVKCTQDGMEIMYLGVVGEPFWTSDINKAKVISQDEIKYWENALMAKAIPFKEANND